MENNLFNCGKFLLSTEDTNNTYKNSNDNDILNNYEKTKKANPNEASDSDKFFKNQYFNSFLFTNIDLNFRENRSNKEFVLYESDIEFLKHDFNTNKDLLKKINITGNAQRILSSPKFSFTVYRDKNFDYNQKELLDPEDFEKNSISISKYNMQIIGNLLIIQILIYSLTFLEITTKKI
mgnify:CR=1 FL=1